MAAIKVFHVVLSICLMCSLVWCDDTRMNVLFIAIDDMKPELSFYLGEGDPANQIEPSIYTPNLEYLASKSLVSLMAYSQFAICTPSRASVLTGRRPDTTKVIQLGTYFRNTGGENFTTIPQYFKQHNYSTQGIGKMFHVPSYGEEDIVSWTEPYLKVPYRWESRDASVRPLPPEVYANRILPDIFVSNETVNALRNYAISGENFFIAAGFLKPHLPFVFPEEFLDLYPEKNLSQPANPFAPSDISQLAWNTWGEMRSYGDIEKLNKTGERNDTLPANVTQYLRQGYYACVSYIDAQIGLVLDELEILGLDNNTVIVIWGDHGFLLGEHGAWGKHSNFELALRVPLLFHVPGFTDSGIVSNELVELVDIFPTVAEAAGLPPVPLCPEKSGDVPVCSEGMSLMPLMINQDNDTRENTTIWKKYAFSQYPRTRESQYARVMGYSVRDDRYRYTEWVGFNWTNYEIHWDDVWKSDLFDFEKDPHGNFNVASKAEYADVVATLKEVLHNGWRGAMPYTS